MMITHKPTYSHQTKGSSSKPKFLIPGVAAALALLQEPDLQTGQLEILLTVMEEKDMIGTTALVSDKHNCHTNTTVTQTQPYHIIPHYITLSTKHKQHISNT